MFHPIQHEEKRRVATCIGKLDPMHPGGVGKVLQASVGSRGPVGILRNRAVIGLDSIPERSLCVISAVGWIGIAITRHLGAAPHQQRICP